MNTKEKINIEGWNSLYDYVISEENIFLAIYSLNSYIFDQQLLSIQDQIDLKKYQDIFEEKNIISMIKEVKGEIKRVLDHKDEYFSIKVFFKPKTIDKSGNKKYRPIHTASLVQLIAMVSMLHSLVYEMPKESNLHLVLSNYSRLIPGNFYGNRISLKPESLFKKWNMQYQKYTELANDYFKTFHNTNEYKYELKLDLEEFFPSIDPFLIYQYMLDKKPVTIIGKDLETFKSILKKLLVCEVSNVTEKESKIEYYNYEPESAKFFTRGIAQGLPQAYFFGNICMIEISKIFEEEYGGKGVYYVDDSFLYTNKEIQDSIDFTEQLKNINKKIKKRLSPLVKTAENNIEISDKNEFYQFRKILLTLNEEYYEIKVHTDGKSTYSKIADAKEGEIFLKSLSREASQIGMGIFTSYSDEEDIILKNRSEALLTAISKELERVKNDQDNGSKDDGNFVDKLHRYYKFFKFRTIKLKLKSNKNTEKEIITILTNSTDQDLEEDKKGDYYDLLKNKISVNQFFDLYKNDIWPAAVSLLIANEVDEERKEILRKYLNDIIECVYENKCIENCYLSEFYKNFLENKVDDTIMLGEGKYNSLDKATQKLMVRYSNMHRRIVKDEFDGVRLKELTPDILDSFNLCTKNYVKISRIVNANTQELKRRVLNAIYSRIYKIRLSDELVLNVFDKKGIQFGCLRALTYLRNKRCNIEEFFQTNIDLTDSENLKTVDYTIFEVLEAFRTFVHSPERIDKLIQIHRYTCDVWKNGAKHLYFYTLHNQEHAVDLVKNIIKIVKTISYIKISDYDYYLLFIACYLHDISMVRIPTKNEFLLDNQEAEEITYQFQKDLKKKSDFNSIKNNLISIYQKIDEFYEIKVRSQHAKDSAKEIRMNKDLDFLEPAIRETVADVAESHMSDTRDIYFTKSDAKEHLLSYKFDKILLRFADLLDMSEYRISRPILNHNIDNMSQVSAFHWISHLLTEDYVLTTKYDTTPYINKNFLSPGNILEEMHLTIFVKMSQMSKVESSKKCRYACIDSTQINPTGFKLSFDRPCNSKECNFLCRWFTIKNKYLVQEMNALEAYLNRIPKTERFFTSKIILEVVISNDTILDDNKFNVIEKEIDKFYRKDDNE